MQKIQNALRLLKNYPQLLLKRLMYEVRFRLPLPKQPVQKRIYGIMFEFDFSYDSRIHHMYSGIFEMREVEIIKKMLYPGDTFIDVGANIGYLSVIGAGRVGKNGQVHSFEPVPEYYQRLKKMALMNPDYKIIINQWALGETEGVAQIDITGHDNIGFNTLVPGFMKPEDRKQSVNVPVRRLDKYIQEHKLNNIALIKIDTEGFEFEVLKGLKDCLINPQFRPAILCEITPQVYSLMGYQLKDLFDYMKGFGYSCFDMENKRIIWSDIKELNNVLFKPEK
jgi:FkbM family methyltransferase